MFLYPLRRPNQLINPHNVLLAPLTHRELHSQLSTLPGNISGHRFRHAPASSAAM